MKIIKIKNLTKKNILKIFKYSFYFKKRKIKINKNICAIFEYPSTRTLSSFFIASSNLFCNFNILDLEKLQISRGESLKDTIKIISLYYDLLIYRGESEKFKNCKIPYINALNSSEHPTQIINDIFTIFEKFGDYRNKKITWVGKYNNVSKSLISISKILKIKIKVFSNDHKFKKKYLKNKKESLKTNVIMSDTWNSMGKKKEKIPKKFIIKRNFFNNNNILFMHCLPMYDEVCSNIKKKLKTIWIQAKNKIFTCMGIIYFLIGCA
ncbi:hypothetical protein ACT2CI_00430 [Candidatus Vidania fulgoroideorum]